MIESFGLVSTCLAESLRFTSAPAREIALLSLACRWHPAAAAAAGSSPTRSIPPCIATL